MPRKPCVIIRLILETVTYFRHPLNCRTAPTKRRRASKSRAGRARRAPDRGDGTRRKPPPENGEPKRRQAQRAGPAPPPPPALEYAELGTSRWPCAPVRAAAGTGRASAAQSSLACIRSGICYLAHGARRWAGRVRSLDSRAMLRAQARPQAPRLPRRLSLWGAPPRPRRAGVEPAT